MRDRLNNVCWLPLLLADGYWIRKVIVKFFELSYGNRRQTTMRHSLYLNMCLLLALPKRGTIIVPIIVPLNQESIKEFDEWQKVVDKLTDFKYQILYYGRIIVFGVLITLNSPF